MMAVAVSMATATPQMGTTAMEDQEEDRGGTLMVVMEVVTVVATTHQDPRLALMDHSHPLR